MHIPDKYRDRYDRLALAHPWMREMRDECANPFGKPAKEVAENLWRNWNAAQDAIDEHYREKYASCETNGIADETNGIADGSPLVEPCTSEAENVQGLPDDSVLYLLRDVAKKSDGHTLYHGMTKLMQAIGKEPEDRRETGDELAIALNTLADMVERDYVRAEDYNDLALLRAQAERERDELEKKIERDYVSREDYEDLRDEFTWTNSFLHRMGKKCGTKDVPSLKAYVEQLEAEVAEYEAVDRRIAETDARWEAAIRDLERMTAERDELKIYRDTWENTASVLEAERDELKAFSGRLETAAHDKLGVTLFGVDYVTEEFMLHVRDTLTAERDEWKAKAEGSSKVRVGSSSAKRAAAVERLAKLGEVGFYYEIIDALCDADCDDWSCDKVASTIRDLLTDDDGATNLEWLVENDRDGLVLAMCCDEPGRADCSDCAAWKETNSCLFKREWLMAPHDDSINASLSQQPESLSDANDDSAPDSDVSTPDVDANDANATHDTREKLCTLEAYDEDGNLHSSTDISKPSWKLDSREKLEADLREIIRNVLHDGAYETSVNQPIDDELIDAWMPVFTGRLDRQAAIVERELCKQCEWPSLAAQPDQEAYDRIAELERERDYWREQVQLCMDSAYPPSHSPKRSYDPDVMAYPDRHGCTTPSTLVAAVIDGMRETLGDIAKVMTR